MMNHARTWADARPVRLASTLANRFRAGVAWLAILSCGFTTGSWAEPRLDVLELSSRALKHNPLGDPVTRRLAVFVPDRATNGVPFPIVYYLPGFGG